MSPTQTRLFVLLGTLMLSTSAHADISKEITLHNDDARDELSVVRNWKQICSHLCSLNLSGPACGSDCESAAIPVPEQRENPTAESHDEYNFPFEHQDKLCETLCDNGLGGTRCNCPVRIIPAASVFKKIDKARICFDFCRYHQVTLRGCSTCPFEDMNKKPWKINAAPVPSSTARAIAQIDFFSDQLHSPFVAFESPSDSMIQATTTGAPTTPDWNRLCVQLCRQGTGGILCNCDLAPF